MHKFACGFPSFQMISLMHNVLKMISGGPGFPGAAGRTGAPGNPGNPGTPGTPGFPGSKGEPGNPGGPGFNGGPGATGRPGNPGSPGFPGGTGAPGTPGSPGKCTSITKPSGLRDIVRFWAGGCPDCKVHGASIGPTWTLSAPDGPMLAPWTLLIRCGQAGMQAGRRAAGYSLWGTHISETAGWIYCIGVL